ncbi:NADH dehydrogenase [ubiquinone] 1 alpha subcomplex assembly factor 3 isoform X2 [Rhynchophorus ferrugineus]|uniref:NADH dehydrogenase [ubiquinone] 1 alpha subcomplex assembly factor 3 isoform X2 n=1 Tax=Rhynchophorus ferrugineus TaxID=354439 RepID=UPI003FCCFBD4
MIKLSLNLSKRLIKTTFRNVSLTNKLRVSRVYEGEGQTTAHILNKDEELGLMIDAYSEVGFRLNNNITILGPMVIFPRSVLSWNIEGIKDVNEDSFSLFPVLEPKIDIIVLGTGDKVDNYNFFENLRKFSNKYKIAFEILPTETACPTFNFLNAEGRAVVGAMIPPTTFMYGLDDELNTNLRYTSIFSN